MNPFAFVRAVREMFEGPIVLAGGVSDGRALFAAEVLGCDLAYMGTKFIATHESMADPEYKQMLVRSSMDDVMLTRAFTGLDSNMLRPSIIAAGLDPTNLPERVEIEAANQMHGAGGSGPKRWKDVWSAGHSISGVDRVQSAAELIERTSQEYAAAKKRVRLDFET
jgi:nitronate monooxygenase